jgi:PTS system nitrogen regulatory IIA component
MNGDGMRLSDYLTRDRTMILKSDTKSAVLDELIAALEGSLEGVSREQLADAVNKREALMSTGIGLGIAVPHVRMEGVSGAFVTVGVSRMGVHDFESIDGEPVRIIVLIVAPLGRHDLYIKLLATVVGLLKESSLRSRIIEAETPAEIYKALTGGGA